MEPEKTISLSDLKAKRAAMTQGRLFTVNPPFGDGTMIRAGAEDTGGEDVADCAMVHYIDDEEHVDPAVFHDNATGIVATHNAADVLIEIAEAALAVESTGRAYRESGWLSEDNPLYKPHAEARCAYNAALAKIQP